MGRISWLRARESNPVSQAYEASDLPFVLPTSVSILRPHLSRQSLDDLWYNSSLSQN